MPCYPCVLACDKGTIKIRVCFRSVVVPVVVGLGRNARVCRDRPRGVICRPPDTRVDLPPHVGTDPVSVRYSRWIRSRACLFRPCRTGAADRHGVCPYMRAFRPSWYGARINEILERDVPERQNHFYCRNAAFQDIKTIFIAGTPRSKTSKPFLLPERRVPRHQTLFYRRNATFQDIKPLFYRRNAAFRNLEP